MIQIKPTRVGILPCLFIVFLWFVLPVPQLQSSPQIDPLTKSAALKSLDLSRLRQTNSRIVSQRSFSAAAVVGPETSLKAQSPKKARVLIVSAVQPTACPSHNADFITLQSVKNKQDYARIHSHDFYLSTVQTDRHLTGAWNKVALVTELLQKTDERGAPKWDWIVWMDYDSLIVDYKFEIPFNDYDGVDFVLWGQADLLFKGDAHMGLNTGVFYVRNTDWSKSLFKEVSGYGVGNGKTFEPLLKTSLGSGYNWGMFDQNGFAHVLKQQNELDSLRTKAKLHLETSHTLNGYWKDFPLETLRDRMEAPGSAPVFVKHFMGCQFCRGINKKDLQDCERDFADTLEYAQSLHSII